MPVRQVLILIRCTGRIQNKLQTRITSQRWNPASGHASLLQLLEHSSHMPVGATPNIPAKNNSPCTRVITKIMENY